MNKKILYIGNDLAKKSGYYTSMETFSSNIKLDGFEVIKYSNKKNKIFRLFHMCIGLIKHKNSVDYVLIDTFSSFSFYYCLIVSQLCRIFKKKYIPILRGGKLPSRINKSIFFSKIIFKNAYKNIAPSYYLKSEFESNGYLVEYIPNILEIDRYQFKKRNQLQVKLLWVRAFKHLYNPNLAIDVILLLKEKFPKLKLCMIGPVKDDSFQKVSTRVFEENLQENVEFTGVLSKQDWHKKSEEFDIFINTTNFDNTPVSVMEAMALGLPIVLSLIHI